MFEIALFDHSSMCKEIETQKFFGISTMKKENQYKKRHTEDKYFPRIYLHKKS